MSITPISGNFTGSSNLSDVSVSSDAVFSLRADSSESLPTLVGSGSSIKSEAFEGKTLFEYSILDFLRARDSIVSGKFPQTTSSIYSIKNELSGPTDEKISTEKTELTTTLPGLQYTEPIPLQIIPYSIYSTPKCLKEKTIKRMKAILGHRWYERRSIRKISPLVDSIYIDEWIADKELRDYLRTMRENDWSGLVYIINGSSCL